MHEHAGEDPRQATFTRPVPAERPPQDFESRLREGFFTNIILEGYMHEQPWTPEWVARDIYQNFYDAAGGTLDGVHAQVQELTPPDAAHPRWRVTIRASQDYPWRRIIALGSGYKEDKKRAAGGKHQGTKDVAVMLLREFGASSVRFESEDWAVDFYADELPEALREPQREGEQHGMFVKLSDRERAPGNLLTFETDNPDLALNTERFRDLFFHSENPDFQGDSVQTDKGGLRLLAKGERGNLYINGQRVPFAERGRWKTLPGMNVWTSETPEYLGRQLVLSRDRDVVGMDEMDYTIVPFLVESMSAPQRRMLLHGLSAYWETIGFDFNHRAPMRLLQMLVEAMAEEGETVNFPEGYVALDFKDPHVPTTQRDAMSDTLKDRGYRPAAGFLSKIGMVSVAEMMDELQAHHELEPSPEERERIQLLRSFIDTFIGSSGGRLKVRSKDVRLFVAEHPAMAGQYNEEFVWLKRKKIAGDPVEALKVYLHEICHEFGTDESAAFSYVLTDVLGEWTRFLMERPQDAQAFAAAWEKIQIDPVPPERELRTDLKTLLNAIGQHWTPEGLERHSTNIEQAGGGPLVDVLAWAREEAMESGAFARAWQKLSQEPLVKDYYALDRQTWMESDESAARYEERDRAGERLTEASERYYALWNQQAHPTRKLTRRERKELDEALVRAQMERDRAVAAYSRAQAAIPNHGKLLRLLTALRDPSSEDRRYASLPKTNVYDLVDPASLLFGAGGLRLVRAELERPGISREREEALLTEARWLVEFIKNRPRAGLGRTVNYSAARDFVAELHEASASKGRWTHARRELLHLLMNALTDALNPAHEGRAGS